MNENLKPSVAEFIGTFTLVFIGAGAGALAGSAGVVAVALAHGVALMVIVLLALLNDGAILSIAYDRVQYSEEPEAWKMQRVLGIASLLGVSGVVASFGLFYLGERVFHLDRAAIQSLMYLKLSVAGHLTIFVTRTRGPFWSIRP